MRGIELAALPRGIDSDSIGAQPQGSEFGDRCFGAHDQRGVVRVVPAGVPHIESRTGVLQRNDVVDAIGPCRVEKRRAMLGIHGMQIGSVLQE